MRKELQFGENYKFVITYEKFPCNEHIFFNMQLKTSTKIETLQGSRIQEYSICCNKILEKLSKEVYDFYMNYKQYLGKELSKELFDKIVYEFNKIENYKSAIN